jgi:hypothetical protein
LDIAEVALRYKRWWMVESWFRSCKSLLETRPIFHRCDETIKVQVSCSFLALVLRLELESRLTAEGHECEWDDVIRDLDRLQVVEVEQDGKRFLLRSELRGTCGAAFRATGAAEPPMMQQTESHPTAPERDPGATPRMQRCNCLRYNRLRPYAVEDQLEKGGPGPTPGVLGQSPRRGGRDVANSALLPRSHRLGTGRDETARRLRLSASGRNG